MRVLVVDDDQSMRELLTRRLLRLSPAFEIRTAEDGLQALNQIDQTTPDLVITDLRMPGCDGLRLAHELEGRYPWIPVVLMSSQVPREIAEQSAALNVRAVVSKADLQKSLPQVLMCLLAPSAQD